MNLICVQAREMPEKVRQDLMVLCMLAALSGGKMMLRTCVVIYDPRSNALTIIGLCGRYAIRHQFDEPKQQYRWN